MTDWWSILWFVTVWGIWLLRNNVVFNNQEVDVESLWDSIVVRAWLWISCKTKLKHLSFYDWSTNLLECLNWSINQNSKICRFLFICLGSYRNTNRNKIDIAWSCSHCFYLAIWCFKTGTVVLVDLIYMEVLLIYTHLNIIIFAYKKKKKKALPPQLNPITK